MNLFIVHASHRLTDNASHGDGLIAWGFIKALSQRGHKLWVAAPYIDVDSPDVAGVELFELRLRSRNKALQLLEYAARARLLYQRLSRDVRFDVVHQMNPVVRGYSFGMVGTKVPLVLGPYNGDWPVTKPTGSYARRAKHSVVQALRHVADTVMVRQARGILITTPYALNRLPGISEHSANLHVVPNGVDAAAFAPSASGTRGDADDDTPLILMVGNATHKGVFTMLAAFERLASAVSDVHLVIAGGGRQIAEVKAHINASRYRDRYRLLGDVERDRMPSVIRDATIVCVPSFGEPFGMIVLEAMATGKPVVGTRAGGIPYLLGVDSPLLFAPGDDAALAALLERLLGDSQLRALIGAHNRTRVSEDFTWEAVARKLEAAYESTVLTDPGGVRVTLNA